MHDPRTLVLRALGLDWLGQFLILMLLVWLPAVPGLPIGGVAWSQQWPWLLFMLLLYPLLGWLFGSYTVLRWRRLPLGVLCQRLLITGMVTLMVVAIARWLINPGDEVWLVYRRVQFLWMTGLFAWAVLVRLGLRRGLLLPDVPALLLLAGQQEVEAVLTAWRRVPQRQLLIPTTVSELEQRLLQAEQPLLVALSPNLLHDQRFNPLLESLEMRDPSEVRVLSLMSLFDQQQERLPTVLMGDVYLAYDDLPWAATLSVQAQLKRMADLVLAALLLVVTSPFVLISALFIWIEDRGPIFFAQERSGWLGRPFRVLKLRTMCVQPADAPACWTEPGDRRITVVGGWLRKVRLDELPQLWNVLNGEMSLIGPRPERPELEHELEQRIPHYRKRHWMRPGLSGWAQVCAPYASSIEDSDLKLSYDLYYLRHFSTWLDLVILFRTIKTVLKASGR